MSPAPQIGHPTWKRLHERSSNALRYGGVTRNRSHCPLLGPAGLLKGKPSSCAWQRAAPGVGDGTEGLMVDALCHGIWRCVSGQYVRWIVPRRIPSLAGCECWSQSGRTSQCSAANAFADNVLSPSVLVGHAIPISLANRHAMRSVSEMPTTAHMRRLRGSRRDPSNKEPMGRDSSFVEHSAPIPTRLSPATPNAATLQNRFPMLHARRSHAPSATASPAPALRVGHGQMGSSPSGNNEWFPSPAPVDGHESPAPHAPGRDPPMGHLPYRQAALNANHPIPPQLILNACEFRFRLSIRKIADQSCWPTGHIMIEGISDHCA
jgi:hypothetical protein